MSEDWYPVVFLVAVVAACVSIWMIVLFVSLCRNVQLLLDATLIAHKLQRRSINGKLSISPKSELLEDEIR